MKPQGALKIVSATVLAAVMFAGAANAQIFKNEQPKADLMITTLGLSMAGGPNPSGSTLNINNPAHVNSVGVGPSQNLCRFSPTSFRPFNKGLAASGWFIAAVYRDNHLIHSQNFNLGPQSGLPGNGWYQFHIDLRQGMNQVKIVMDPNGGISESDESNNVYTLNVNVNVPCTKPGFNVAPGSKTTPGASRPGIGKRVIPGKPVPPTQPKLRLKRN